MSKNYYDILGISEDEKKLSEDEFKKILKNKYRSLSLKHHPDKNNGDETAEEKFKEISEAYNILSDNEKRKKYDFEESMKNGNHYDFFGRGMNGFGRVRHERVELGEDIFIDMKVTLEDIYKGNKIRIKYNQKVPCHVCNGTGSENGRMKECDACGGTGVFTETKMEYNMMFTKQTICTKCKGTGRLIEKYCDYCEGSGFESIEKIIDFKLPKTSYNGSRVLLNGIGDLPKSKNGIPGNVVVTIYIMQNDYFNIINGGLVHYEKIPFTECILGTKRKIKFIDGRDIELQIPELTENDKKFVINDCVMWDKPYVVVVKYELPKKLTKKQRQLLEKFEKENYKENN